MPDCRTIRRKNRKVCVGDLDSLITIKDRAIKAVAPGSTRFSEKFDNDKDVWALIETTRGDQFFDGTSLRTGATHKIYIRYDASITQEDFIFFENTIYDVLDVEDLEERHDFMKLLVRKRGTKDKQVNER